ncbi:MAG: sugar ABC transporter ATP-binding protein [Lachnospiraceae bacterium]|nr:sugar ABC transporter ATP-binding protein [Lachnospiraceae bacterium]
MSDCILQMEHITKRFAGVTALDDVSLSCEKGKVHVLAGENGAGKSTILKILAGIYAPDEGTITLRGEKVKFDSPADAQRAGIAMVFQELTQINELTIFENIFLSKEKTRGCLIDRRKQMETLQACMDKYGLQMDPSTIVDRLSVGQKQLAEILKVLVRDPEILILDEPTSALASDEVQILFGIVRKLTAEGKAVIFISHRMEEMFEIGDIVTVFKDGQYVDTTPVQDLNTDILISKMVGRALQDIYPPHGKIKSDEVVFELKDYKFFHAGNPLNLQVHSGEIIGIAGLTGHGQTEFINSLAGLHRVYSGQILIHGKEVQIKNSSQAVKQGVALVPSDRKQEGLLLQQSIRSNIALGSLGQRKKFGLFIDRKAEKAMVDEYQQKLRIKLSSLGQEAVELSGGNQQKVVLAKELGIRPKVILFNEPTKGIDVGNKREFYYIMRDLADQGVAVIMYSTDLMEVIGISDKVLTMYEQNVNAQLTGSDIEEETIMRYIMGVGQEKEGTVHE